MKKSKDIIKIMYHSQTL